MWYLFACSSDEGIDTAPIADTADAADTRDTADTGDTAPEVIEDPCPELGSEHDCCREWTEYLWACGGHTPRGEPTEGSFSLGTSANDNRVSYLFTTTSGEEHEVDFHSKTLLSRLPDLPALGTVTVIDAGGCETDGEGADRGTFAIYAASGALVLAIGSAEQPGLGELGVTYDEDDESCEARPDGGCFEAVRNHAVTVALNGQSVTLYQGASAPLGDYEALVLAAMFAAGASNCDDVGGHMENWAVLPAL